MKIFWLLLIPFFIFSQNPDYPDTLYLKSGKIYPCLVNGINNITVKVLYRNNIQTSTALMRIDDLVIGPLGSVYNNKAGFSASMDSIFKYISERNKKLKIEMGRISLSKPQGQIENQWSFGVFYVPTYSIQGYEILPYNPYNPWAPYNKYYTQQISGYTYDGSLIEGNFSYFIATNICLVFDISYNSIYIKQNHNEKSNNNSFYTGHENTEGMKTFEFNIGFKYYLAEYLNNKVRAFIQAGLGKKFAFGENDYKELRDERYGQIVSEDNRNEFLEDVNSPFQFNLGFGTEYYFNNSLSLFAAIRIYYSKINGTYNFKYTYRDDSKKIKIDYENSEFLNRIGLGLNFYF